MPEHLLFLTGRLAEKQLHKILTQMQPEFTYTVHSLGVKVAALITAEMISRRLTDTFNADRIIIPGRCRGNINMLAEKFNIPFERGPEELKDLPLYFGKSSIKHDLSHYSLQIFAEIVDAPNNSVASTLARAAYYRQQGADVIDIGCLPDTPFPHLETVIKALKAEGYQVSIDSLEPDDLLRGGQAGADYMLSLHENTLWIADEVNSTPILIPEQHGHLDGLFQSINTLQEKNKNFIVDPILDPIHFGFADSLVRYHQVRQRYPNVNMMLGVGNLTELTHADTLGINTLLLGLCSELNIDAILTTEVSTHAHRAVKEADYARRIMYAAKQSETLPKHIDGHLMALHETAPFPYTLSEIKELANQITDPSYRIQISQEGLHIFNRDGFNSATDPFDLYPKLDLGNDSGHAFYLGVELARAEIAWQLGKRFNQDQPLTWGCATEANTITINLHNFKPAGTTLAKQKKP